MSHLKVLLSLLALSVAAGKLAEERPRYHADGDSGNTKNLFYLDHLRNMSHADTERPNKPEAVIEKFFETLTSGERYLKMVETVERKLQHLDATFHERSDTIIKYLAKLLADAKQGPTEVDETALIPLKAALDKLKVSVSELIEEDEPTLRGRFHGHSNIDHRLNVLEDSVKNIAVRVKATISSLSEFKNSQYTPKYLCEEYDPHLTTMLQSVDSRQLPGQYAPKHI